MKKLLTLMLVLAVSSASYAQRTFYYKARYERPVTVQVSPQVFHYEGLKYGAAIGMNVFDVVSVNYFHLRDYDFSETGEFYDNRYAGLYASAMMPVSDALQVGPAYRMAALNSEWQKPFYAIESRYALSESLKIAVEYGKSGNRKGFGLKLVWNLY